MAKKDYDSLRDDYKTPPEIYERILKYAGIKEFDLDVCCSEPNIPAKKHNDSFYVDGLLTEWVGKCFLNPPFNQTIKWVKKAVESVSKYKYGTEVFCVLPADRFETKFYQDCIVKNPDCLFAFLQGKQGFIIPGQESEPIKPSQKIAIVIFTKRAAEWAYSWNYYDWFNTKAFTGMSPAHVGGEDL